MECILYTEMGAALRESRRRLLGIGSTSIHGPYGITAGIIPFVCTRGQKVGKLVYTTARSGRSVATGGAGNKTQPIRHHAPRIRFF